MLVSEEPPSSTSEQGRRLRDLVADRSLVWMAVVSTGAMVCAWGLVSVLPVLIVDDELPPSVYGTAMIANTIGVLILPP